MNKALLLLSVCVVTLILLSGCLDNNYKPKDVNPTIEQGIYGTVRLATGNCMPGVTRFGNCAKVKYVSRDIYIEQINGTLKQKIKSSRGGVFELELPAGNYVVLVDGSALGDNSREPSCKASNTTGYSAEEALFTNAACTVTVAENNNARFDIYINHISM